MRGRWVGGWVTHVLGGRERCGGRGGWLGHDDVVHDPELHHLHDHHHTAPREREEVRLCVSRGWIGMAATRVEGAVALTLSVQGTITMTITCSSHHIPPTALQVSLSHPTHQAMDRGGESQRPTSSACGCPLSGLKIQCPQSLKPCRKASRKKKRPNLAADTMPSHTAVFTYATHTDRPRQRVHTSAHRRSPVVRPPCGLRLWLNLMVRLPDSPRCGPKAACHNRPNSLHTTAATSWQGSGWPNTPAA